MNVKQFHRRFFEFGGWRLVVAYTRLGLFPIAVKQFIRVCLGKESVDNAYVGVRRSIDPMLCNKYRTMIGKLKQKYDAISLPQVNSHKIWFCWLQGMENAPELVKCCYRSLKRNIPDREIVVITFDNISQYVTLPEYIIKKYKRKQIPAALFADLIRLELLIKYGGTWSDATVLCTGSGFLPALLDCNLFMFSWRDENGRFLGASNWFITASSNNKLLLILREVLYQYWKNMNCVLEYYMFHLFFCEIAKGYPDLVNAMPKASRRNALLLDQRFTDTYDDRWMQRLLAVAHFHKLNYRKEALAKKEVKSFGYEILKRYGADSY